MSYSDDMAAAQAILDAESAKASDLRDQAKVLLDEASTIQRSSRQEFKHASRVAFQHANADWASSVGYDPEGSN